MIILGIESSCDDTAVAIINENREILSNKIFSQIDEHSPFGGVVPEVAARSHMKILPHLFCTALSEANVSINQLDGIAVTAGPGLIGGVIVGLMFAKGVAAAANKPLIGVNHLEGHALSVRLIEDIDFPYLLMMLSGGHCQILIAEGVGRYRKLGQTKDDAIGEAFDKVSKMLGLGYPGGPIIEKMARHGNPNAFLLPMPLCRQDSCDFSFSGLKTAARNVIAKLDLSKEQNIKDMCASLQYTITGILLNKLDYAIRQFDVMFPSAKKCAVLAGGVAANRHIYKSLRDFCRTKDFDLFTPPVSLCTDNAAMIAWAGLERLRLGMVDGMDITPKSRWPLENA